MSRSSWKIPYCASYILKATSAPLKPIGDQKTAVTTKVTTQTSSRGTDANKAQTKAQAIAHATGVRPTSVIRIWSRASTILPNFVGRVFNVHNGMRFIRIEVTSPMIGHKFGEFAATRKIPKHPKLKSVSSRATQAKGGAR